MTEPIMTLYVIYDHPRDYPDHFVLRRWCVYTNGTKSGLAVLANTADDLRKLIAPDHMRTTRDENDDPAILEVWI